MLALLNDFSDVLGFNEPVGVLQEVSYGIFSTRFECSFICSQLISSVVLFLSTLFECSFISSQVVSSVVLYLLNSFRVQFYIFPTRFECDFRTQIGTSRRQRPMEEAQGGPAR
jgi:hypothetical protein